MGFLWLVKLRGAIFYTFVIKQETSLCSNWLWHWQWLMCRQVLLSRESTANFHAGKGEEQGVSNPGTVRLGWTGWRRSKTQADGEVQIGSWVLRVETKEVKPFQQQTVASHARSDCAQPTKYKDRNWVMKENRDSCHNRSRLYLVEDDNGTGSTWSLYLICLKPNSKAKLSSVIKTEKESLLISHHHPRMGTNTNTQIHIVISSVCF